MGDNKKKNTGLIAACWLLFSIILLIVFFVQKDTIVGNLKRTDFFGRVFGKTPEFVQNYEEKNKPSQTERKGEVLELDLLSPEKLNPPVANSEQSEEITKEENIAKQTEEKPAESQASKPIEVNTEKKEEKPIVQKVSASLCFVNVDSDGSVNRKTVKRPLSKSDSPLTDAITALLLGPLPEEKNCMTLIPSGTKLLGASVKNGIAYLNFNENFEFNPMGVEGYIAQLMQIVYTATEFSTVKSVQFLVEGEHKDYLGSEGQWIGSPLARSSF